ncbi:MAG: hypothetical protein Q4B50_08795, partial [Bacillota bacterium]|nr:hypothetical protein [Bacillota bacterium]
AAELPRNDGEQRRRSLLKFFCFFSFRKRIMQGIGPKNDREEGKHLPEDLKIPLAGNSTGKQKILWISCRIVLNKPGIFCSQIG